MEQVGKYHILFVCLGNICRSPAAQGVMQRLADESGLTHRIFLDSAGFGSWHVGDLPDIRMRRKGKEHGYQFDHRARVIDKQTDFKKFDKILVMDRSNYSDALNLAPTEQAKDKIEYLASYMTRHPGQSDIPDPYYGTEKDFEKVIELLEDACTGLLTKLKLQL